MVCWFVVGFCGLCWVLGWVCGGLVESVWGGVGCFLVGFVSCFVGGCFWWGLFWCFWLSVRCVFRVLLWVGWGGWFVWWWGGWFWGCWGWGWCLGCGGVGVVRVGWGSWFCGAGFVAGWGCGLLFLS
ncbi:hypothetical protein RA269_27710, partial [Pseudomonas syringae pv. tagetis]|uniref:hypothetical protein n=1 Tax=Pseudomonas syringae group genomosp. 7 TaxID=251699 RepID=UPI00376FB607